MRNIILAAILSAVLACASDQTCAQPEKETTVDKFMRAIKACDLVYGNVETRSQAYKKCRDLCLETNKNHSLVLRCIEDVCDLQAHKYKNCLIDHVGH